MHTLTISSHMLYTYVMHNFHRITFLILVVLLIAISGVLALVSRAPAINQEATQTHAGSTPEEKPPREFPRGTEQRERNLAPAFEGPVPGALPEDPNGWKSTAGFYGPYFNPSVADNQVAVLEQSVVTTSGPTWRATGLVRNQTGSNVEVTSLRGTLFDSEHHEIGTATASVLLSHLRPGEPGPFVSTASPSGTVASVEWKATHTVDADPTTAVRSFEFLLVLSKPYGDRERLTNKKPFLDPPEPPYPYLVLGSVRNVGKQPVADAKVIAAWLDDAHRVIHAEVLPLRPYSDYLHDHTSVPLSVGQAADFAYANGDATLGPRLSNVNLALWGVGQ